RRVSPHAPAHPEGRLAAGRRRAGSDAASQRRGRAGRRARRAGADGPGRSAEDPDPTVARSGAGPSAWSPAPPSPPAGGGGGRRPSKQREWAGVTNREGRVRKPGRSAWWLGALALTAVSVQSLSPGAVASAEERFHFGSTELTFAAGGSFSHQT